MSDSKEIPKEVVKEVSTPEKPSVSSDVTPTATPCTVSSTPCHSNEDRDKSPESQSQSQTETVALTDATKNQKTTSNTQTQSQTVVTKSDVNDSTTATTKSKSSKPKAKSKKPAAADANKESSDSKSTKKVTKSDKSESTVNKDSETNTNGNETGSSTKSESKKKATKASKSKSEAAAGSDESKTTTTTKKSKSSKSKKNQSKDKYDYNEEDYYYNTNATQRNSNKSSSASDSNDLAANLISTSTSSNKWNPKDFIGEFRDSLGHQVYVMEVPQMGPEAYGMNAKGKGKGKGGPNSNNGTNTVTNNNLNNNKLAFHAHFVKFNKPDKRFVLSKQYLPNSNSWTKVWTCGNGIFQINESTKDKIVFRTMTPNLPLAQQKTNIWVREPPKGLVFFDPPPELKIDVEATIDKMLCEMQHQEQMYNEQMMLQQQQYEEQQRLFMIQQQKQSEEQNEVNDKNNVLEEAALKEKERIAAKARAEFAAGEKANEEIEQKNNSNSNSNSITLPKSGAVITPASVMNNSVWFQKDNNILNTIVNGPNTNRNSQSESLSKKTRPVIIESESNNGDKNMRVLEDGSATLEWKLQDEWKHLKERPLDFGVISPQFNVGVVENLQLTFFPTGRKNSEFSSKKGSTSCGIQLNSPNLPPNTGLKFEILINGVVMGSSSTGPSTVSTVNTMLNKRFLTDYNLKDYSESLKLKDMKEVVIGLRVVDVFTETKKVQTH